MLRKESWLLVSEASFSVSIFDKSTLRAFVVCFPSPYFVALTVFEFGGYSICISIVNFDVNIRPAMLPVYEMSEIASKKDVL